MTRKTRKYLLIGLLLLLILGFVSACSRVELYSLSEPTATSTEWVVTAVPTLPPTATIVWFPPTATARPLSTPTPYPTAEMKPDVGTLVVADGFDRDYWQTIRSVEGNAVLSDGELTLARQNFPGAIEIYGGLPWMENYYLTVDVTLSICSNAEDVYGLLFKMSDSDNLIRLWINCLGQTKLESLVKGKMTALTDWASNGRIRPGAPQKYQLGLWVRGERIRVFVNDTYLFETKETLLSPGGIGLTARSAGVTPITVTFSDLQLYNLKSGSY